MQLISSSPVGFSNLYLLLLSISVLDTHVIAIIPYYTKSASAKGTSMFGPASGTIKALKPYQTIYINAKMLINYWSALSMQWNIENSLVCPVTGTGFSVAASAKNLKLIIWYNGDYFWTLVRLLTSPKMKCSLTASPAIYRLFTLSLYGNPVVNVCPVYRLSGQWESMLLICNRRSLCNSPCAPTVRGKRGQNKALPWLKLSLFLYGQRLFWQTLPTFCRTPWP